LNPEQVELINYRLERATESMDEARLLLDNGHLNTCVNRLYYACFYTVSALLMTKGFSSPKHSGVRALFDQHWVKDGHVSVDLGRIYRNLFVNRQKGDYGELVRFKEEEVRQWVINAERFIKEIGQVVQEGLPHG